mgnify:FL=1
MKQKKMLSLLLAVATLMSGLSLTAFAQEENPFVLEDPYMIEYSVGERGLNFSSEQAIQQVKEAFSGLDPTPIGQDTVVEQDARYLEIWQDSMPDRFIFQDDKLLTYPNDYKTPQALLDLEADLQAQMKELDPYGCFTWSEDYTCICLLDNTSRYAVFNEETENKILMLERLQSLEPSKINASQNATLGKERTGASELRVNVTPTNVLAENVTYSYQFYDKGVGVTAYTGDGAGVTQYFSCDPTAIGSLTAQMQKFYDSQQKSATWLAIINPARVESLHVGRKGKEPGEPYGEAFPLTNWNSAAIIDLLRTLPVEGAAETNRLWTRPDVEYRLGFTNALTYRVQVQGNQLRVWASDMPQVLQFTVPQKEVDELLTETDNRITYEKENIEKPNPETAKPVIYLYPEQETKVNVQLTFNGTLTSTYPTLPPEGWTVTAQPDGTLTDEEGRSYRYLFWEGVADVDWKQDSGFLVKAEDAREFLEQSLTQLGLNELEQNDFITYWLPKLEKNGESFVTFAAEQYTDNAVLTVTPQPDSVLRVQMLISKVDDSNRAAFQKLPEQELPRFEREGFVLVEWGGTDLGSGKTA